MAISGSQEFWVAGARVFIQPDPPAGVADEQYLLDFGVITEIDANIETEEAVLKDTDGGILKKIDEVETSREESYMVTIANFNPDNLNILYGADGIQAFAQSATQQSSVSHHVFSGRLVKIHDANSVWIYGLTSVDTVTGTGGSPTYTEGTDWEVVDLERGIIRIISGGAIADDSDVEITFTPKALSGNRLIRPQTGGGTVLAKVGLFMGRAENAQQHVREMRCSINTEEINLPTEEHATWVAKMSVLQDFGSVSEPFGRLLHFVGDLPALS